MTEHSGQSTYYNDSRLADYSEGLNVSERGAVDLPFLLLTLLLLAIGMIMLLSASFVGAYYGGEKTTKGDPTYYFTRQLAFAALGLLAMYLATKFPLVFYRRLSKWVMIVALGLLVIVAAIGVVAGGAQRWIGFGAFSIQPSEIAKLAVVLTFADMICRRRKKMAELKQGFLPFCAILAVLAGLVALQPHLSGAIIITAVGMIMLFLGGAKIRWFVAILIPLAIAATGLVLLFPHASVRIKVWLDPLGDPLGDGWQIAQSLYAIGSGGLMGLGLGQSRQKYLYLPEEHNDFIFSIICEELGFIGAILILALFALLIMRGYWLATQAQNKFDFLVCSGLTSLLAMQVILNIAVVTSIVPCTGISLPFFSYGGSALIMQLGEMGLILSMSRDIPAKKSG